jgi:predicted DNA-binding transcriptional regulator AlpA
MATETHPTSSTEPALVVGRLEAARLCGVSPASWDRQTSAGRTPKSLRLGGRVLWRRADLSRWVELGMPDRATFEALTAESEG